MFAAIHPRPAASPHDLCSRRLPRPCLGVSTLGLSFFLAASSNRTLNYLLTFQTLPHSFALFCTFSNLNSFLFKQFRALRQKTRGWGIPPVQFSFPHSLSRASSAFANPLFSMTCALFQLPYPVSLVFTTLTKTTGLYTNSSHFGTPMRSARRELLVHFPLPAQNSRGWRFGNSLPKYSYARAVATRPRGVRSIIPICIR